MRPRTPVRHRSKRQRSPPTAEPRGPFDTPLFGIMSGSAPVTAAPPATDGDHLRLKYVLKSAPPGVNFRGAREPVFDLLK